MQGDQRMLEYLNEVLTAELTAINQYFLSARMLKNWGFERLAQHLYDLSIDEMRDAEDLVDRVLYLDGLPNLQRLGVVGAAETPQECLELALESEREAVERLNRGVALAVEVGDNGSREMLAEMLSEEEEHLDWLETQLDALERLGASAYLAQQLHEGS